MSSSETDSEPEPELATDTVSTLRTFAHLSATRPSQGPTDQGTVSWAVDTLATLDFRLVRKDTALHGLIQNCASTILALFQTVLEHELATDNSYDFLPDVASILRPSFLHLLFQYRRLFRVIAARDFKPNSAPLAIVCWVDVVLAKLGNVVAFVAAGLDRDDLDQSLPESLKAQGEEHNLRAAIQLPDNWDMLPSMLLSERVSAAAKRLSIRLMLGRYILCPALSGQAGVDDTIHKLLSTFAEFVRQSAARVDELRSVSGLGLRYLVQQERLTGAMAISLFAVADMAQDSTVNAEHVAAFRPQTMAAAMLLLRFVLNEGEYPTQTNVLSPLDHLDIPSSVIIRWGIVPQWAWSIWLEYRSLYADTIMCLTTAYVQHHMSAGPEVALEVSDLMSTNSRPGNQAAVISVMIDLVFRFITVLSADGHSKQLSAGMMSILHGSCRLIAQWMNRNSCRIQNSTECCKALIILFGYLSQNEQHFTCEHPVSVSRHLIEAPAVNDLVIECLALMRGQCTREAWKAAAEDNNFHFLEALGQSFMQTKTALSRSDLSKSTEIHAAQLMQFLVVMMSRRVQPLDLDDASIEFIQAVGDRVLEMPPNDREFLCETFLICLAAANISRIDLPWSKLTVAADEAVWRLGTCSRDVNLFLASAFSLYITSALVNVEPLTYLEGLEHLLDMVLLICTRHYPHEDEPLALIVLPTICDALVHLLEHRDDTTGVYTLANTKISALGNVLRSFGSGEDSRYGTLLKRRLSSTARRVLREVCGEQGANESEDADRTRRETRREYELVFCRLDGVSHLIYVTGGVT